jgi:choline dehydrogenase-like flavoprotein
LFGDAVEAWQHIAVYYAANTSEGRGRVLAVPGWRDPVVTYHLTRRDRDLLGRGLARLALVLLEAGATAIYPSFRGAPVVRSRRDLAALTGTFVASRASLMTVHLCSTVPAGGGGRSVADSAGLVRGTANVYVNDASLLPDAPGVNPQASVMALAIRNVRRFLVQRASRAGR